jgi:hypothetical protein
MVNAHYANQASSQQTEQLIAAAKISALAANKNALAAASFADSARKINSGVNDAVNKLNLQAVSLNESAEQTGRLASATEQANSNAVEGERPWFGGQIIVQNLEVGKMPTAYITFMNSGKRPAKVIHTNIVWFCSDSFPADPESEYRKRGLSPNSVNSQQISTPGTSVTTDRNYELREFSEPFLTFLNRRMQTLFIIGRIDYQDIQTKKMDWTKVCVQYVPPSNAVGVGTFGGCEQYNDAQ